MQNSPLRNSLWFLSKINDFKQFIFGLQLFFIKVNHENHSLTKGSIHISSGATTPNEIASQNLSLQLFIVACT